MLPTPRPFDPRPAIARLQTDRTDMLRELHPDLRHVWDELDQLRAATDTRTEALEGILDAVTNRLTALHIVAVKHGNEDDAPDYMGEIVAELDECLTAIEDGRAEI